MELRVITQDGFLFHGQNRWFHVASFGCSSRRGEIIYMLICDTNTQKKYVHELVGLRLKPEIPPEDIIRDIEEWLTLTTTYLQGIGEVPLDQCIFLPEDKAYTAIELTKIEDELNNNDDPEFQRGYKDAIHRMTSIKLSDLYLEGYKAGYSYLIRSTEFIFRSK